MQPSDKQTQSQLLKAYEEIDNLKLLLTKAEQKDASNGHQILIKKLEVTNNEKKALQEEMKQLVNISSQREDLVSKENQRLRQTIENLQVKASDREL